MAVSSSLSTSLSMLSVSNTSISSKPRASFSFFLHNSKPPASLHRRSFPCRIFIEAMESQQILEPLPETLEAGFQGSEVAEASPLSTGAGVERLRCTADTSAPSRSPENQLCSSPAEVSAVSLRQITIRNNLGENIVGILHDVSSSKLVILCHGFRSSKESKTIMSLADFFANERISVFRFDFSGNGDSQGSFGYGNYWKEVDDLRAVVKYFAGQKRQVDAIAGHSKGGNVVLLYASKYDDVSTVINISGRFDLRRGIEERLGRDFMQRIGDDGFIDVTDKTGTFMYRVTKESLEDRLGTDMRAACLSIGQNCRVLTVHGSEDDIVPPEDALEFSKLISNHKLQLIEGADHRYMSHQFQLAKTLVEFIRPVQVNDADLQ